MVRNDELPQMGAYAKAVADAVKVAVEAAGISGSGLARRLGKAQSYVSLRLNGRKAWNTEEVDQIAAILGTDPFDLISRARH